MATQSAMMKAQPPAGANACESEPTDTRDVRSAPPAGAVAARARTIAPAVDIYETATAVVMLADVPGVAQEGIEITVDRGVLTLRATQKTAAPQGFKAVYQEYAASGFERRFTLSDAIDTARISARVEAGVLRIELPKAKEAMPRRIEVKVG